MIISAKEIGSFGICLGIGLSGGSLIKLPIPKPNEFNQTIGDTSIQYTSDNQWRFLYLLAGKVFEYLKTNVEAKKKEELTGVKDKTSVIDWLKSKFNVDYFETQDKWESFREVCTQKIKEEDSTVLSTIRKPEVRLCFMGEGTIEGDSRENPNNHLSHVLLQLREAGNIGFLGKWPYDKSSQGTQDSPYKNLKAFEFNKWTKYNYQLWDDFAKSDEGKDIANNNKIGWEGFKEKWDLWYKNSAYSYGSETKVITTQQEKTSDSDSSDESSETKKPITSIEARTKLSDILTPPIPKENPEDSTKPKAGA